MYRLIEPSIFTHKTEVVRRLPEDYYIPFDPANTDYANFKAQIFSDEAELQDADGNLMSPEESKAFVATLP